MGNAVPGGGSRLCHESTPMVTLSGRSARGIHRRLHTFALIRPYAEARPGRLAPRCNCWAYRLTLACPRRLDGPSVYNPVEVRVGD